MFHYSLDNEVQSDSLTRIFDQHDASGQFSLDALLADPLHTGWGSCSHVCQACRGLLGWFGGGWAMLIPMNQFAKMPGQNLEESFEVKVR